jgi:hypothetical protein
MGQQQLRPPRWELPILVGSLVLAVAAAVTEWQFAAVSQFWTDHPMLVGLVSGGLIIPPLLVVIERYIARLDREHEGRAASLAAERWRAPAVLALNTLAETVLRARERTWAAIQSTCEAPDLDPEDATQALVRAADFNRKLNERLNAIATQRNDDTASFLGDKLAKERELASQIHRDMIRDEVGREEIARFRTLASELHAALKELTAAAVPVLTIALYPPLARYVDVLASAHRALRAAAGHADRLDGLGLATDSERRATEIASAYLRLDKVSHTLEVTSVALLREDRDPNEPFEEWIQRLERERELPDVDEVVR